MSNRIFGWIPSLFDDDMGTGSAPGAATGSTDVVGPTVNVDGTPMLPGGILDVLGKVFGDSGTTFGSDMGGGTFGTDGDSSNIGGSDW